MSLRAVLDTNIFISGMMLPGSAPGRLLNIWLEGTYDVLTCDAHIEELKRVSRYSKIRSRVPSFSIGRMVNQLRETAIYVARLPAIDASPDPWDNYLLALAQTGEADFLVTGDKAGLLALERFGMTRIVTARQFLESF
jgi:hypothetical protein